MQNLAFFLTKLDTCPEADTVYKLLGHCSINNYNY